MLSCGGNAIDPRTNPWPRRLAWGAAILFPIAITTLVFVEVQQRRAFVADFERDTSIQWPEPGGIAPPLFWLGSLTGETWVFVATSREENERLDVEIRPHEERPRDYRGGSCQIDAGGTVYEITVYASDAGVVRISRRVPR